MKRKLILPELIDEIKKRERTNHTFEIPIHDGVNLNSVTINQDDMFDNNYFNNTSVVHIDNCGEAPPIAEEYGEMRRIRDPKVNSLKMLGRNLNKTTQKSRKNNKAAKCSRRINRS